MTKFKGNFIGPELKFDTNALERDMKLCNVTQLWVKLSGRFGLLVWPAELLI